MGKCYALCYKKYYIVQDVDEFKMSKFEPWNSK